MESTGLISGIPKNADSVTTIKSKLSLYKIRRFWKQIILSLLAVSIFLTLISPSVTLKNTSQKKNVIFFVTDGMGPTSLSLARSFKQHVYNLPIDDVLTLDKHLIGSSRTRSSDSLITDSAAGATAFSCRLKTYNGAIGIDPQKNPCGTLLEAAKLQGYMTGLVVTTRITDATPASFSAHADYRFQEDLIASQQLGNYPLGRMVDLLMGGGRSHFYSSNSKDSEWVGNGGARADDRNLIQEALDEGWSYVGDRASFDDLQNGFNVSLPLLALLADNDIPFDFDRDPTVHPSLKEQAMTAINALDEATKDSDEGFFIMIEGSRIDHAGHQNDPASQAREVLAFDEAFEAVLDYVSKTDTETIVLSTSDHETGGLVTAKQVTRTYPDYIWFPEVLANSTHSGEYLKKVYSNFIKFSNNLTRNEIKNFIKKEIFENGLHIFDYREKDVLDIMSYKDVNEVQEKLNRMISWRAQIGWTTHGHSAVDVNIYAYSNRKTTWYRILDKLQGNHENTEIGKFMEEYMNLNLDDVTDMIQDTVHHPDMTAKELENMDEFADEYFHHLKISLD
ncbi:hypothetical protein TBLA_0H03350 [Henningerozyma blattae CBS 6284]|uniref:Alkaline phosphatase n=1 Tax=Henningerozyma blattae (strain ATCC 34711 / CBS 6284 / DSM 70876 / NBRC 10599 / NRRL Y-10934 / UCD 77-7) TaxID=1071380 RepID=I2H8B4_HENB6|nr:hypothetical protein TBLA_0H03350 [Tetrapisispora blattae CBS 6284]CCH62616.1 hypothetical protein TBLA_0H03350 [Tetrapisispora blattae CBS 6284]